MTHEKRPLTIGLSPAPTIYKIHWHGGNDEYVRCEADILLNGLEGDLEGEAHCPFAGTKHGSSLLMERLTVWIQKMQQFMSLKSPRTLEEYGSSVRRPTYSTVKNVLRNGSQDTQAGKV